jgi:hypothetical protein
MRRAKPHELKTNAVPVMTARLSEAELSKWVPVPFDEITDPLATPEPSKGALVRLDAGEYVGLYYGKESGQLLVEVPETTDGSVMLAAFFREVPLPVSRVLWHRPDVRIPKGSRRRVPKSSVTGTAKPAKRSARSVGLPRDRK